MEFYTNNKCEKVDMWCRLFHKWFGKETQVFQNYLAKHNMTPLVYGFEFYCPKCNKVYWRKTG